MKNIGWFFVLAMLLSNLLNAQDSLYQKRIGDDLLKSIVRINSDSGSGTGFIIHRDCLLDSIPHSIFFIITNKHVISNWNIVDSGLTTYFNPLNINFTSHGRLKKKTINILDKKGIIDSPKVMLHPEHDIDVALIVISSEFADTSLTNMALPLNALVKFNELLNINISIGEQIYAAGFPLDIYSTTNYYPIIISGHVSTLPGEVIKLKNQMKNRLGKIFKYEIEGKLLLIDGMLIFGNSGGPVFAPVGININPLSSGGIRYKPIPHNYIIGIMSSSMIFHQGQYIYSANLNFVYSSDYIIELIDMYCKK
jgi:S1-C subfamily serine protease